MASSGVRDPDLAAFLREVPIVDAHQHFWDLTADNPYPNLTDPRQQRFRYGDKAKLRRDYMPADYRRDVAPHKVVATVHIQVGWPDDPLGETVWLAGVRAREMLPSVALGGAELQQEDAAEILAGHAREPWMRGVRTKPWQTEDPRKAVRGKAGSMDDPAWRRGFEHLARHDFVCDVQVPFWHLDQIADLARDHPGTPIAINHTALPSERSAEGLQAWHRALESVASLANIHLKLSGIGVPPGTWPVAENIAVVRDAIRVMGWQKCLFASNFPVDGLCASFDVIFSAFKQAVADRPREQIRALFHDNARALYRIPEARIPERSPT